MSLPNQFIHVVRSVALKGVKALIQIYTALHEEQGETTNMGKRWNGWMDFEGNLIRRRHCLTERCRVGRSSGLWRALKRWRARKGEGTRRRAFR